MNRGRLVFVQIMDWFSRHQFDQIVFSYMDQFLVMAFCAAALCHAGFRSTVACNTLSVANAKRPWGR